MTQDNTATEQAAQDATQNAAPKAPDTLELPPMLRNTDALEALLKKAAGQVQ